MSVEGLYQPGTLLVAKESVDHAYSYYGHYSVIGELNTRSWKTNKVFKPDDTILVVDYQPRYEYSKDYQYRVWVNGEDAIINKDVLERTDYYEVVK